MVGTQYHGSLNGIPGLCGEGLPGALRGEFTPNIHLRVHTQCPAIFILES